jgi:NAD(P)-dependent dehydrogenase (short-subunit alcohol dehydrogenase family)
MLVCWFIQIEYLRCKPSFYSPFTERSRVISPLFYSTEQAETIGANIPSHSTFQTFAHHLNTNTIGPLLTAQHLLSLSSPPSSSTGIPISPTWGPSTPVSIRTLVFISSDSGSTTNFRAFEDGFGAYAASKAALNQGLRHLAAELGRKNQGKGSEERTVVLALHPGEVSTDMANVSLDWDVEGIISPRESIGCMLKVIEVKGWGGLDEGGRGSAERDGRKEEDGAATFWTWEGKRYPW